MLFDFFCNQQILVFQDRLSLLLKSPVVQELVNLRHRVCTVGNEVFEQVDEGLLVQSDNELSNDLLLSLSVKRGREAFVRVRYSRLRVVVFDPLVSEWVVDFLLRELVQVMVALVDTELVVDLTLYLA